MFTMYTNISSTPYTVIQNRLEILMVCLFYSYLNCLFTSASLNLFCLLRITSINNIRKILIISFFIVSKWVIAVYSCILSPNILLTVNCSQTLSMLVLPLQTEINRSTQNNNITVPCILIFKFLHSAGEAKYYKVNDSTISPNLIYF